MKKIYLDNAASTKIDNRVFEAMLPYLNDYYGNPSSVHSFGKPQKVILEETRDIIATFLGAKPKEIFFTSGGTESNNFAIKGSAFYQKSKNHIITSTIEHPAVLDTVEYLRKRFNYEVTYVKPDKYSRISADSVLNKIKENTFLVSIMHSNNETGIINEITEIGLNKKNILFHCDTVQSVGKIKLNLKELNLDFATLSAHKFYGPKGIGILYIRDGIKIDKYIHGGGQERNMRGGTENIPAIVGLKKAIEILNIEMENDINHYRKLKTYLVSELKNEFGNNINFNSREENCLQNIVNVSFDTAKLKFIPDMLLIQLDLEGIAVSGGSACSSGSLKPSKVLLELGLDEKTALASLRISFGRENKKEDIKILINKLKEIIKNKVI